MNVKAFALRLLVFVSGFSLGMVLSPSSPAVKEVVEPVVLAPEAVRQHDDRLPPWLMQHPLFMHEDQCPDQFVKYKDFDTGWRVHCVKAYLGERQ